MTVMDYSQLPELRTHDFTLIINKQIKEEKGKLFFIIECQLTRLEEKMELGKVSILTITLIMDSDKKSIKEC